MERRLIEAANTGDVDKLRSLIDDYPPLLRAVVLVSEDTPLHIACIGGHVNFVKEVLSLRPEFSKDLNQDGFSPLHIASAIGDVEIVKELLKVGNHLCLVQGKEKRIPLHYAVAKGRIQVIRELLAACPNSITEVTAKGEACFHLAVTNNKFEALKFLCKHVVTSDKEDFLNMKDEQGNTILHLAISRKQYEFVDLLLDKNFGYKGQLEVNSLNQIGLTPLDVLISEGGDPEMEKRLTVAGASVVASQGLLQIQSGRERRRGRPNSTYYQKLKDFLKYDVAKDSPSEARNALLVIAVLIATATYQAGLSPPGGAWPDGMASSNDDAKNSTGTPSSTKQPIYATQSAVLYSLFLLFNSIGFLMSLEMMYFLTHGLPMNLELRVALAALVATYFTFILGAASYFSWMLLILLSIMAPVTVMMVPKAVRLLKKGRSQALPSARANARERTGFHQSTQNSSF